MMKGNVCNAIKIGKCNFFCILTELCDLYKAFLLLPR